MLPCIPRPQKIVLESTGRYHLLPAFSFSQKGLDVRVVNPITAKRYIQSSIRRKKTDPTDASALGQMATLEKNLPPRFSSTKVDIQIRQKMGIIASLEKQMQSLTRMLQSYTEFQEIMEMPQSPAERSLQDVREQLHKQKKHLEEELEALVLQQTEQRPRQKLALSIPGISPFVAALLCQFLSMHCQHPKQWICFVGLDIAQRQSGTWNGRGMLSKRGNPYLRKRLFSAAWGAAMNDDIFRAYYDRLKERGHSHREALLIIARKLLRILFAVLKNNMPFSHEACCFGS